MTETDHHLNSSLPLTTRYADYRMGVRLFLLMLGIAAAVHFFAEYFLAFDPTDPHLLKEVGLLRIWILPLVILSVVPLYFVLARIRVDHSGAAFRCGFFWRQFRWEELRVAEVRYCDDCLRFQIEQAGNKVRLSLRGIARDDRERLLVLLADSRVIVEDFLQPDFVRVESSATDTAYEISETGIVRVTGNDRMVTTWEEVDSAFLLRQRHTASSLMIFSVEIDQQETSFDHASSRCQAEIECGCRPWQVVASLIQNNVPEDRLTIARLTDRLDELKSEGELELVERHLTSMHQETRRGMRWVGLFLWAGTLSLLFVPPCPDAKEVRDPLLKFAAVFAFGGGLYLFLGMLFPAFLEFLERPRFNRRRQELTEVADLKTNPQTE